MSRAISRTCMIDACCQREEGKRDGAVTYDAREGEFAEEEVCAALVLANLAKCERAGTIAAFLALTRLLVDIRVVWCGLDDAWGSSRLLTGKLVAGGGRDRRAACAFARGGWFLAFRIGRGRVVVVVWLRAFSLLDGLSHGGVTRVYVGFRLRWSRL